MTCHVWPALWLLGHVSPSTPPTLQGLVSASLGGVSVLRWAFPSPLTPLRGMQDLRFCRTHVCPVVPESPPFLLSFWGLVLAGSLHLWLPGGALLLVVAQCSFPGRSHITCTNMSCFPDGRQSAGHPAVSGARCSDGRIYSQTPGGEELGSRLRWVWLLRRLPSLEFGRAGQAQSPRSRKAEGRGSGVGPSPGDPVGVTTPSLAILSWCLWLCMLGWD